MRACFTEVAPVHLGTVQASECAGESGLPHPCWWQLCAVCSRLLLDAEQL